MEQKTINLKNLKIRIRRNKSGNFNVYVIYPNGNQSETIINKLEFEAMKELEQDALQESNE